MSELVTWNLGSGIETYGITNFPIVHAFPATSVPIKMGTFTEN
jgi:hypothetical protein